MTLLDRTPVLPPDTADDRTVPQRTPIATDPGHGTDADIDLVRGPDPQPDPDRRPLVAVPRAMRIERIRLGSAGAIASVFWTTAGVAVLGTAVVLWTVASRIGAVGSLEGSIASALGSEAVEISGWALLPIVALAVGAACVVGLVVTVLLAVVYNAAATAFGGLAVRTGPIDRGRRVASDATSA